MEPEDKTYAPPEIEEILTKTDGERDEDEVIMGVCGDDYEMINNIHTGDLSAESSRYMKMSHRQLSRGLVVTGGAGYGKTTLFENILLQLAESGHGFCYIDLHGDGATDILQQLPKDRLDDVVYIGRAKNENTHQYHPFEILEVPEGEMLDPNVVTCMFDNVGPKTNILTRVGGTIANKEGHSLFELHDVFEKIDLESSSTVLEEYPDMDLDSIEPHNPDVAPLLHRISDLGEDIPAAVTLFDPNGASIYDAIEDAKIVIADFGSVNSFDKNKIANALLAKLHEVLNKSTRPEEMYPVVCGQFSKMSPPNGLVEKYTSHMRSMNAPLFAGVQFIEQMYYEDKNAIFNNVDNFVAFNQCEPQCANEAVPLVGVENRDELLDIPRYVSFVRTTSIDGERKVKMTTLPSVEPRRNVDDILI